MATITRAQPGVFDTIRVERPLWSRVLRGAWWFMRRKPLGALGAFVVIVMVFIALTAQWLAPHNYELQDWNAIMQDPSLEHPFGTDNLGRDVLSRVLYGARVSIVVGFAAVAISALIATTVGSISGYFGGWFDSLFQRFVDIWMCFPPLVLLITAVSTFSRGGGVMERILAITLVMGFMMAAGSSRVIRGGAISIKHNQYVEAARTIGASDFRILTHHIVPNVFAIVIILATVQLGAAILLEASISFLGYGVPKHFPSWGQMLSSDGISLMRIHAWLAVWPGLAIALSVYSFNMLGDALRDVLDPRLRGRR